MLTCRNCERTMRIGRIGLASETAGSLSMRSGSTRITNVGIYWGYVEIDDGFVLAWACANSFPYKWVQKRTSAHTKSFSNSHTSALPHAKNNLFYLKVEQVGSSKWITEFIQFHPPVCAMLCIQLKTIFSVSSFSIQLYPLSPRYHIRAAAHKAHDALVIFVVPRRFIWFRQFLLLPLPPSLPLPIAAFILFS